MIRRTLIFLSVANYLLAVTVGGWFHDHGQSDGPTRHECSASHDGRHASDDESSSASVEHDVCSICRFLAQKPIPTQSIETIDSAPLEEEVATARPIRRASLILSADQIRAPPRVA